MEWVGQAEKVLGADEDHPTGLDDIKKLLSRGMSVPPYPTVEDNLGKLQHLLNEVEMWEDKTKMIMESSTKKAMAEVEEVIEATKNLHVSVENLDALKDAYSDAKEWLERIETLQVNKNNKTLNFHPFNFW